MKKITSLTMMMMMVLYSIGAFAQATDLENKFIRIGSAQDKVVPGKWYFLHNPRNPEQSATDFVMPGEPIQPAGGLVEDKGAGSGLKLTATTVVDELTAPEGTSSNNHMNRFVRFVAAADAEGAYYIQFGTGNWMAAAEGGNSTNVGTVTNNEYLAGQAGKYNFYLVSINGAPNKAGRFGWNKYNMANRIDNNGAGNGVVFWGEGVREAGEDEMDPDDGSAIKGNHIWQIYDIEIVGEEDPYESEFNALINTVNSISERENYAYIENLRNGSNIGNSYGNYRAEDVAAFLEIHDRLENLIFQSNKEETLDFLKEVYPTVDDLKAEHERYKAADQMVRANKIPMAIPNIAPGYYTILNVMDWYVTRHDTIYYTQEEADKYNEENEYNPGDEGFVTPDSIKEVQDIRVAIPSKALCSKDSSGNPWLAWDNLQPKSEFLWKIENVEGRPTQYRLINMYRRQTINNIPEWDWVNLASDDTVTVVFDYTDSVTISSLNKKVLSFGIRNTYGSREGGYQYVNCWDHGGGSASWGWTIGWTTEGEPASKWYLEPISDETADEWINSDEAKLRKMFAAANQITGTAPAQIEISKDFVIKEFFENDSIVTDASQISSPYTTLDAREGITIEDTYAYLLDGNPATFWHSRWEDGNQGARVHYLQIEANENIEGTYTVKLARRAGAANDHPIKLAVVGYDENNSELGYGDGEYLGSLSFPFDGDGTWATAHNVFDAKGHKVFRFYWEASSGTNQRGYWHCSAFNIFRATDGTVHEKSQYQVRAEIIAKLEAAMKAWNEGGYSVDNIELVNDPEFNAAYNALIEAGEAWKAVYVNPAELRNAIASAPKEDLFVIGNNPGQWQKGTVNFANAIDQAKAYDATCTYTPAESEKMLKTIADAIAETFAAANKVKTGKWYRIKFPTEKMYETYGWSKTGAQAYYDESAGAQAYPELFGKTVAAGKGVIEYVPYINADENEDTLATYHTEIADELFNGNGLYFFDNDQMKEITNGEDLFRFIQATDTSYIVQNKATGLFLRGGHPASLSDIPTYFYTKAVGAGTNIITYTTVLGEKVQHCNLHGQRSDNGLVCWESTNIGSNSALLIEEAEDVTEEPSTVYRTNLWPGSVYAYTKPVDVTISADAEAVAYGAELAVDETDTVVVLKKIEAETIKAGTPYILIANETHDEYITPADRLAQIAAEYIEGGNYGYFEKQEAAELLNEEYVAIEMGHGMTVDTLQKGNGDLVGTFHNITVNAGKGIVAKDNGFAHTLINTAVDAYGAYIKCDFDPESTDVLSTIAIKIEGSIADGITDALGKVAKSGNIYTVDGKLVGKGNINAINSLPAGIYIVNGVKVTKN